MKEQHQTIAGFVLLIVCMCSIISYYTFQYLKTCNQPAKTTAATAAVTENMRVVPPKPQTPDLANQIKSLQTMIDKASDEEARKLRH